MPRNKVKVQLDMLGELDKPNQDRERFVDRCVMEIQNNQYLQVQILISHLTKRQIEYMSAKMAESNLTLCHVAYYIGLETGKYRHWSSKKYDKLSVVPDTLSYTEPWSMTELHESLTKAVGRITGLFIANKNIVSPWQLEASKVVRGITTVKDYAREQRSNG